MGRGSERVAVIGAGPSGLAAARYLKAHGFEPVIYEAADRVGGQWNAESETSGVWPAMRTNTSRVMTRFSDLDYPAETEPFPRNDEVLAYLENYAALFGLKENLRTGTTVETVARHPAGGWAVHSVSRDGPPRTELYRRVVVAAGRYTRPAVPDISGLASFTGSAGVSHSFDYAGPAEFEGETMLVAGCSISALEIASELAAAGVRVISTVRRQRYVVKKLVDSVPVDHACLTRFGALAGECFPADAVEAELKQFVLQTSGDPAAHGCLPAAESIAEAGLTLSEPFLDHVAAGRITARPWIGTIEGRAVHFVDGSSAEVDGIILGTGFKLDLPFIDRRTRKTLGLAEGAGGLRLYHQTFHPDLQGLAFVGLFPQVGPYFPVVELQARWIAYAWAGLASTPARETMLAEIEQLSGNDSEEFGHVVALRFARAAGVEPVLTEWPGLARALLFGPLSPASFRLNGPDALPGASWEVMAEAARLGAVTSPVLSNQEKSKIAALVAAGGTDLAWLVGEPATREAERLAA